MMKRETILIWLGILSMPVILIPLLYNTDLSYLYYIA